MYAVADLRGHQDHDHPLNFAIHITKYMFYVEESGVAYILRPHIIVPPPYGFYGSATAYIHYVNLCVRACWDCQTTDYFNVLVYCVIWINSNKSSRIGVTIKSMACNDLFVRLW